MERQKLPIARRLNIVRMRRNNPCATLQEIGSKFGVTRERVRQILEWAGKTTVAYHQTYLCIQCGKDMGVQKKLFCNRQCQYDYCHIKVTCVYCGKFGEYRAKRLIWRIAHGKHSTDLFFCSQYCHGKWLAENYGFVVHPENIVLPPHRGRSRKWDWSKVYELRDETGWGVWRISRALGIPTSTVSNILSKRQEEL